MALTPSTMLELGTQAPAFSLQNPKTQELVSLSDYSNQAVLIAFISNHCPYVIILKEALAEFAKEYEKKGLTLIAINANDIEKYPADSPAMMVNDMDKYQYSFPYLFDETQKTALAYKAACTPDFYLFNAKHTLYYRGQFDDTRPGSQNRATGIDMRNAADTLLEGLEAPVIQKPSMGCSIKWKEGNNPTYF